MDPYLEGYLWPDVHQALPTKIRQLLVPLVRPKYVVRMEVQVIEDDAPEEDIGIMYPDVEVLRRSRRSKPPSNGGSGETAAAGTPAVLSIPAYPKIRLRIVNVHVRRAVDNRLVTSIEIVSPVNKRKPGLEPYRAKRQRLMQSGVHLLEIDLLRRGERPIRHPRVPACDYLLASTRAGSGVTDLWPLTIRDPLPVLAVPLRKADGEVPLDLAAAIREIYDEAQYDLSIDYGQPPPPPELASEDRKWMAKILRDRDSG